METVNGMTGKLTALCVFGCNYHVKSLSATCKIFHALFHILKVKNWVCHLFNLAFKTPISLPSGKSRNEAKTRQKWRHTLKCLNTQNIGQNDLIIDYTIKPNLSICNCVLFPRKMIRPCLNKINIFEKHKILRFELGLFYFALLPFIFLCFKPGFWFDLCLKHEKLFSSRVIKIDSMQK